MSFVSSQYHITNGNRMKIKLSLNKTIQKSTPLPQGLKFKLSMCSYISLSGSGCLFKKIFLPDN